MILKIKHIVYDPPIGGVDYESYKHSYNNKTKEIQDLWWIKVAKIIPKPKTQPKGR